MGAIYRREIGAFFSSGIAYIFLAVFYLFAGYFFYASSLYSATTDMSGLFSSLFMVVVFLIPILTMRLFSEELKQKTDIYFNFTEIKEGRKVVAIEFEIKENTRNKKKIQNKEDTNRSDDSYMQSDDFDDEQK